MTPLKPLDLLVITPLDDEEWACQRWFTGETIPSDGNLKWMQHPNGLSIGLFSFKGMGSVVAATKTAPLLQTYRPRNVFLLGIAAGRPFRQTRNRQGEGFRLGDVAYNKSIYYCSFGKVKGERLPQIRAVPPLPQSPELARVVDAMAQKDEWRESVKKWHDRFKDEWRSQFSFPAQKWPKQPLRVLPADVGSGELVVASEKYQKAIRAQYPAADITVFEMEAFAVGTVCQTLGIPFLTIRGISDFARAAKDDQYRLAAALAPAALMNSILQHQGISQLTKHAFSLNNSHSTCFLPIEKTPIPCPYEHKPNDRKCVDSGIVVHKAQPALLTKAQEHVEPPDYSRSLDKRLKQLSAKEERVVFFFPYSAEETARLCVPDNNELIDELKELVHNGKGTDDRYESGDRARIVEIIRKIAEAGRELYPHFRACEDVCKELMEVKHVAETELPTIMSRVIITSDALDRFEQDSMNLIYSLLLGTDTVPTFLMSANSVVTKVRDDIIFFETVGAAPDGRMFNWLKAVRFFPNSWLLLTTGWPCAASGKKEGGERKLGHISGLYSTWWEKISSRPALDINSTEFREFPNLNHLEN